MRKIACFILILGFLQPVFALSITDHFNTNTNNNETQIRLNDIQQQLENAEFNRELDKSENEDNVKALKEQANLEIEVAKELVKQANEKAESATHDLQMEILRSNVKANNSLYFGVLLLAFFVFVAYIIKSYHKTQPYTQNQKYGVLTMILSISLIIYVFMISETYQGHWDLRLDFIENLMIGRIELFETRTKYSEILKRDYSVYLIDFESKNVVLSLLFIFFYGLTTYSHITPAIKFCKKSFICFSK